MWTEWIDNRYFLRAKLHGKGYVEKEKLWLWLLSQSDKCNLMVMFHYHVLIHHLMEYVSMHPSINIADANLLLQYIINAIIGNSDNL